MAAKGRKRQKKKSAGDDVKKIYLCNLNFVPPKDQNLETIFEEPRQTKDGDKVLTSKLKYKRYLNFDSTTTNKIQKRKRKVKKCVNKFKSACRVTRSSPKASEIDDISAYINILDDSSSDSEQSTPTSEKNKIKAKCDTPMVTRSLPIGASSSTMEPESSCFDLFETPKKGTRVNNRRDSEALRKPSADSFIETDSTSDTQETILLDLNDNAPVESPKRSCLMS